MQFVRSKGLLNVKKWLHYLKSTQDNNVLDGDDRGTQILRNQSTSTSGMDVRRLIVGRTLYTPTSLVLPDLPLTVLSFTLYTDLYPLPLWRSTFLRLSKRTPYKVTKPPVNLYGIYTLIIFLFFLPGESYYPCWISVSAYSSSSACCWFTCKDCLRVPCKRPYQIYDSVLCSEWFKFF